MAHIWGYVPFPTHLILSCTNQTEYDALTTPKQRIYDLIISAGAIDSHPGNLVMERLLALFPEGTQTRTNLETLLAPIPFIP